MKTKIADTDADDNYITKDMDVISIPVLMMIDMMCFTGTYCHKSMLESNRTRQAFRDSFQIFSMQIAGNKGDEFWASWTDYQARFPVGDRPVAAAAPGPVNLLALHGDSDDEAQTAQASAEETGEAAAGSAGPPGLPGQPGRNG